MIQDNPNRAYKPKNSGKVDLKYRRNWDTNCNVSREYYDVERFVAVSVPGAVLAEPYPFEAVEDYYDHSRPIRSIQGSLPKEVPVCEDGEEPPEMVPACEGGDNGDIAESVSAEKCQPLPSIMIDSETAARRVSAILNIYDYTNNVKLNNVVDVVGVLYNVDPSETGESIPEVAFSIEVVQYEVISEIVMSKEEESLRPEASEVTRSAIKTVLTNLLHGDETAAEYLLLSLVSSRIEGPETHPNIGAWSLCLNNADHINLSEIQECIRLITESDPIIALDTSNDTLLNQRFYPLRSDDSEFISPGILQLPFGSTVIIDERQLKEGTVNALNVLAINKAVRDQEMIAIFGSSDVFNFKLNSRFIILNNGESKSLFSSSNPQHGVVGSCPFVSLSLKVGTRGLSSQISDSDKKLFNAYIQQARIHAKTLTITESVVESFQNAWVEARKEDNSIPTEDVEAWATLLRSVAASRGLLETSDDVLSHVIDLEGQRRSRRSTQEKRQHSEKQSDDALVTGG